MTRKYPKAVENTIMWIHVFTVIYLALTAREVITGRPLGVVLVFLAFSLVPEVFCVFYKRKVRKRGFEYWRFKVLAHTFFPYKRRTINCVVAAPCVSRYTDKLFEIIIRDDEEPPEVGKMIEVCIPKDAKVREMDNRYLLGSYYDLSVNGD